MQYFGGKTKIAGTLAQIIASYRKPGQLYVEPFVGGGSVLAQVGVDPRIAYDSHAPLIAMWLALQGGWTPPTVVTEETYQKAKEGKLPAHLTAFIGFGCSFSGRYFQGFARNKRGENFAGQASRSLLRKLPLIRRASFHCADYRELSIISGALIYCDPPYSGTKDYAQGRFDSVEFWKWVRRMSFKNRVLVSEYSAPKDFREVWRYGTETNIRNSAGVLARVERLFTYEA